MNIGKAIKILLHRHNMSQKELADKIQKSETSVSLIMKSKTQPRKETLEAIAAALGVSVKILLLLSVDKEDIPEDKKEHYDLLWPNVENTLLHLFTEQKK
jgi:XRE family transcriptional regulator, regulator of sulfur utilization